MKNLSSKWQKAIVWLTGWLNIIAFVLAGGYVYLKTDDEDVKGSAKTVLALWLGFTGIELVRSLIYNIANLAEVEYKTLNTISDIGLAITVVKAVVFLALFILDLCGIKFKRQEKVQTNEKTDEE